MSAPKVRKFTRDSPCTKIDIWRCFRGKRCFRQVDVVEAHSIIGVNSLRNMRERGYIEEIQTPEADLLRLTKAGRVWLTKGLESYLKRNIHLYDQAHYLPWEVQERLIPRLKAYRTQMDLFD